MADDSISEAMNINYNVAVAKRMTVPDEIRLTGPPRQAKPNPPSSKIELDGQLEGITVPDTNVKESASSANTRSDIEPPQLDSALMLAKENREEMMARIEAVEEQVRQMKERLDDFETSTPYLGTRKSVLNTLVFVTWLALPIGILYLLTPRRR